MGFALWSWDEVYTEYIGTRYLLSQQDGQSNNRLLKRNTVSTGQRQGKFHCLCKERVVGSFLFCLKTNGQTRLEASKNKHTEGSFAGAKANLLLMYYINTNPWCSRCSRRATTEHPKCILIFYCWGIWDASRFIQTSSLEKTKKHFFSDLLDAGRQRMVDANCQSTFKDSRTSGGVRHLIIRLLKIRCVDLQRISTLKSPWQ